jgi:hydrophobe/amphiphile efflux-1 (HAE1) family protein
MISEYFIKRKIIVIALFLMVALFGFISLKMMPMAQYPKLTPPTISISASYPGADAQTIASSVIEPIESELFGLKSLMYMDAKASNSGSANITCTFEIGTDIDAALIDVQNRVATVDSTLPSVVKNLGIQTRKKTSDILMIISLHSPDNSKSQIELSNYASNYILKKIKTIPGASEANVFGKKDYSMRIWTDPVKLANFGLTSQDIIKVIQEQNNQVSIGFLGQEPAPAGQVLSVMVKSKGRLQSVEEFENIIVKTNSNGLALKIKDIAKVELGTADYNFNGKLNGKPTVLIGIFADPEANALDTAEQVKNTFASLSHNFPSGIEYSIPYDTTTFVKLSIEEVVKTFFEAIILVSFVIYFFLHSFRASIIPIIAIPVSVLGTFIIMHAIGFSINTLTLFGLVLSIGIVVDDAIVVVENVERIVKEEHLDPTEASIKAMKQITSPIIAIVFVISSVFVPTVFMGGITGELYKQFAITIAIAVFLSGIVALTLSPVLCSLIIKNSEKDEKPTKFDLKFKQFTQNYINASMFLIRRKYITLFMYILFFVGVYLLSIRIPTSFLPSEDQGFFITSISLPEGASAQRTNVVVDKIEQIYKQESSIANIVSMVARDSSNTAMVYSRLKEFDDRKDVDLKDLIKKLSQKTSSIKEAQIMLMQPPAIRGLGRSSGLQMRILSYGDGDTFELAKISDDFAAKLAENKSKFLYAKNVTKNNSPTLYFELDREKAKIEGINISDVYEVLRSTIGYANINQFEKDNHLYWVQIQSLGQFRDSPQSFDSVYIRNSQGRLIPVSQIGKIVDKPSPSTIERFNGAQSNSLTGMLLPGHGTKDAMKIAEEQAKNLPAGYLLEWDGMSLQEKLSDGKAIMIFGFGILMVFLVLSMQYNSFVLPFAVILSVIFGVFGAFVAQALVSTFLELPKNIYFAIGLLTLIGLSSKNAILIIEFAEDLRKQGVPIYEATNEAAKIRYRPMMMTSIAFIFGILPLIFSSGAGAESRFSIGIGLFGGMIAATFIERYFIPYIYYYVSMAREKFVVKKEA